MAAGPALAAPAAPAAALGQTVLGLVAILLLIAALAWMARRLNVGAGAQAGVLRAEAVLPLGARERLVLVRAGDVQLLVGVAPGRVQHIHTFTEPLPVAATNTPAGFKDALQALLQRGGEPRP